MHGSPMLFPSGFLTHGVNPFNSNFKQFQVDYTFNYFVFLTPVVLLTCFLFLFVCVADASLVLPSGFLKLADAFFPEGLMHGAILFTNRLNLFIFNPRPVP